MRQPRGLRRQSWGWRFCWWNLTLTSALSLRRERGFPPARTTSVLRLRRSVALRRRSWIPASAGMTEGGDAGRYRESEGVPRFVYLFPQEWVPGGRRPSGHWRLPLPSARPTSVPRLRQSVALRGPKWIPASAGMTEDGAASRCREFEGVPQFHFPIPREWGIQGVDEAEPNSVSPTVVRLEHSHH